MLGHLAKVSYILSLIIIMLWLHLHDLSFDCPENDGLIKASLKNQTTLINHKNGSKANPPKKCVDGIKENTTMAHNKWTSHSNHENKENLTIYNREKFWVT